MNNIIMFLTSDMTAKLTAATQDIVDLIKSVTQVGLGVFGAIMAGLSIPAAVTYSRAEDDQVKRAAKQRLQNLLIAFVVAFALLVLLTNLLPIMTDWYVKVRDAATTAPTTTTGS